MASDEAIRSAAMQPTAGRPRLFCGCIGLLQLMWLAIYVASRKQQPFWDEPWYLDTVPLLHEKGLTVDFFRSLPGPAGPLYTFVHFLAEPLTHLRQPGVRLVNVVLLAVVIVLTGIVLRGVGPSEDLAATKRMHFSHALIQSLALMGVPTMWILGGMALTELPAIVFVLLYFILLRQGNQLANDPRATKKRLACCIGAGLALGIAATGRQPFLVMLAGLPFLIADVRNPWRDLLPLSACVAACIAVIAPLFWMWQGLVPPSIHEVSSGLAPNYGLQSFAYAALFVLIFAPRMLVVGWRIYFVAVLLGLFLFLLFAHVGVVTWLPMYAVVQRIIPQSLIKVVTILFGVTFDSVAALMTLIMARLLWASRNHPFQLALVVATTCLLLTPMKITHQFSSRYVAMAAPFLLVAVDRHSPPTLWKALRLAVGGLLGFASLSSYYASLSWIHR